MVVSGGQACAQPPVQVLEPAGSGLYSYRVLPLASTSVSPSLVVTTLTRAALGAVVVGAPVELGAPPYLPYALPPVVEVAPPELAGLELPELPQAARARAAPRVRAMTRWRGVRRMTASNDRTNKRHYDATGPRVHRRISPRDGEPPCATARILSMMSNAAEAPR